MRSAGIRGFSAREWVLLLMLLAVQFVHIVDFVLIMPLAPLLMRSLEIDAAQFGLLVSAYTLSAAGAGLLAGLWIDRFDRRPALLVLLAGFGVATLLCGLASSYATLLAARSVAGAFGGVLASLSFAIVGDQIPAERRGSAMGVVASGFSAASVLGLPLGLGLAVRAGWQLPFQVLAGVAAVILLIAWAVLTPMRSHLTAQAPGSAARELREIALEPGHLRAFALTAALMVSGFTVLPYLAAYLTANAGLPERHLDLIYLVGGLATLATGPLLFGPLADRWGHARVFVGVSAVCIAPILLLTNLAPAPLWLILALTTLLMVLLSGRMISATALITSVVDRRRRGRFMSLNAAVQHGSAALASGLGTLLIGGGAGTPLTGYSLLGGISAMAVLLTLVLAGRLRAVPDEPMLPMEVPGQAAPVPVTAPAGSR